MLPWRRSALLPILSFVRGAMSIRIYFTGFRHITCHLLTTVCVHCIIWLKAWSAITGEVVFNLRRQAQPVYSIAASPTGRPLILRSNAPLLLVTCFCIPILDVMSFNIDDHWYDCFLLLWLGDLIATGSLGGFVSVWSLKDGSLVRTMRTYFPRYTALHCMKLFFTVKNS